MSGKRKVKCTCQICGNEFLGASWNQKYCNNCLERRKYDCCGKTMDRLFPKNQTGHLFCNRLCQQKFKAQNNVKPGNCIICGQFAEKRDSIGRCHKCVSRQVEHSWLEMNDDERQKRLAGLSWDDLNDEQRQSRLKGISWEHMTEEQKEKRRDFLREMLKPWRWDQLTDDQKIKRLQNLKQGAEGNFVVKDHVRFYKGQHLETLCKQLLNGSENIQNYPGFSIRFGRVCYQGMDVLTDEKIILNNSNFYQRNEVLYYFDQDARDYVAWEDYRKRFLLQNVNFQLPGGFEWIPTFRKQDSDNWEGSRGAFEHHLMELNIEWFIYIKFYVGNDGEIKPLVVGKSGSILVNSSGSDVSFSVEVENGPARRFLHENGLQWCKTRIAIMKCKDEIDAYSKEKYWMRKLNLFGS